MTHTEDASKTYFPWLPPGEVILEITHMTDEQMTIDDVQDRLQDVLDEIEKAVNHMREGARHQSNANVSHEFATASTRTALGWAAELGDDIEAIRDGMGEDDDDNAPDPQASTTDTRVKVGATHIESVGGQVTAVSFDITNTTDRAVTVNLIVVKHVPFAREGVTIRKSSTHGNGHEVDRDDIDTTAHSVELLGIPIGAGVTDTIRLEVV